MRPALSRHRGSRGDNSHRCVACRACGPANPDLCVQNSITNMRRVGGQLHQPRELSTCVYWLMYEI